MEKSELTKLKYITDGLAPGIDYLPEVDLAGDEVVADFVERGQLQATELNALGGVNALGGSLERRDEINLALDDGFDLLAAVEQFGDEEQKMRVRRLISTGQITS